MPDRLIVVLGAGASADSVSPHVTGTNDSRRPPVVRELFHPRFAEILNRYPMAQSAAADIRRLDQTSLSIEEFLREKYAPSSVELTRRKFLSVPLYLQDVMLDVSYAHSPQPDNYDLLISYLSDLLAETDLNVLFVTLNYDLILDRRLDQITPLDSLESYTDPDRRWALIKLHGSVDWGRMVMTRLITGGLVNPPADLAVSNDIMLARGPLPELASGGSRLDTLRLRDVPPHGSTLLYPALSAPLGEDDELSCPPEHVGFLRNELQVAGNLHLLVIGYSAVDLEVLRLLRDTSTPIKSFGIVNQNLEAAQQVGGRLHEQTQKDLGDGWVWDSTFGGFVQRDGWDRYKQHLMRNL